MVICINGEAQALAAGSDITTLLKTLGLSGKRLAIEVNGELIPRSQHAQTLLKPEDRVEIVHAVGGG